MMRILSITGPSPLLPQCHRHRLLATGALAGTLAVAALESAQADVITSVNDALLNIIQNTSASLIDGPPEVAREIAMIDGSMFDAVNAASGKSYAPITYAGPAVSGASADAAALQAAITVMDSLYEGPGSLYQQYKGVTGAEYYGLASPYRNTLVGPSVTQMNDVATQISGLVTDLANLGSNSSVAAGTILGTEAGIAMIAARANDGATAANLQTLTPFFPPNNGQPGVYVPPTNRPAMTPTWGTVAPFGMSAATLSALAAMVPAPPAIASQAYANQVLQTECVGSGTALPASVGSVCAANGYYPELAAEAGAALFWNDPGGTLQPPGHWLQIADTVSASQNLTLLQHAREGALVGEALSDAGSAVWALRVHLQPLAARRRDPRLLRLEPEFHHLQSRLVVADQFAAASGLRRRASRFQRGRRHRAGRSLRERQHRVQLDLQCLLQRWRGGNGCQRQHHGMYAKCDHLYRLQQRAGRVWRICRDRPAI